MHENDNHIKAGIQGKNIKYQNDEIRKLIEEVEEKAFLAGYDYAIEVLKSGRVHKKEHKINRNLFLKDK